ITIFVGDSEPLRAINSRKPLRDRFFSRDLLTLWPQLLPLLGRVGAVDSEFRLSHGNVVEAVAAVLLDPGGPRLGIGADEEDRTESQRLALVRNLAGEVALGPAAAGRTQGQQHEMARQEEVARASREVNYHGHPPSSLATKSHGTETTSPWAYVV